MIEKLTFAKEELERDKEILELELNLAKSENASL